MNFWKRRQLRSQAQEFLKAFRKQRVYNSDLLAAPQRERAEAYEAELSAAVRAGDAGAYDKLIGKGDVLAAELFPVRAGDALRENVEVMFVAIAAALALRAYFLQPFKIPTDSMFPTLYGVQAKQTAEPFPSLPLRAVDALALGKTFGELRFDHPVTLVGYHGGSFTPWFEYTDLYFDTGETGRVWLSPEAVSGKLGLFYADAQQRRVFFPKSHFQANEPVVRYVSDTGSQVLVDKFSYNFRLPKRGEVFVFRTNNIEGIENDLRARGVFTSQFYIKRCVGVPGDTLRVAPPLLEINGSTKPVNPGMARVESGTYENPNHGYRGYGMRNAPQQHFLVVPSDSYRLEPDSYWAMGDNSYNSLDSRFWGPVPRTNLVGPGFIVYWPFGARWGFIR